MFYVQRLDVDRGVSNENLELCINSEFVLAKSVIKRVHGAIYYPCSLRLTRITT